MAAISLRNTLGPYKGLQSPAQTGLLFSRGPGSLPFSPHVPPLQPHGTLRVPETQQARFSLRLFAFPIPSPSATCLQVLQKYLLVSKTFKLNPPPLVLCIFLPYFVFLHTTYRQPTYYIFTYF